jgi:hypothetical protein
MFRIAQRYNNSLEKQRITPEFYIFTRLVIGKCFVEGGK